VLGWSRSPKALPGIASLHGMDALNGVIAQAEMPVIMLPLTPATRGLMNEARLQKMPPGANRLCRLEARLLRPKPGTTNFDDGRPTMIKRRLMDLHQTSCPSIRIVMTSSCKTLLGLINVNRRSWHYIRYSILSCHATLV
jgi:hypothetical protein